MGIPVQQGFLRLSGGSMGGTTFLKINGQYRTNERGVFASKHKWKYDPGFARRREIASQFTNGVKASKLIRESIRAFINRKGIDISSRLRKELLKVVYMDKVSGRGNYKVVNENLSHLTGYNFNQACSLRSVFNTRYTTNFNRQTGEVSVNLPSFVPSERIKAPKGTTHFTIVSAALVYDFGAEKYKGLNYKSDMLPWNDQPTEDLEISLSVPENSTDPLFIYFGIEFMQEALGNFTRVSLSKLDPLCIVDVIIT